MFRLNIKCVCTNVCIYVFYSHRPTFLFSGTCLTNILFDKRSWNLFVWEKRNVLWCDCEVFSDT